MRVLLPAVLAMLALSSCASKPCKQLVRQVCEAAPGSKACENAGRLTAQDECLGFLVNVPRYIELSNEEITTPTRRPPAPTPASAEPGEGAAAPSESPAAPAEGAAEAPSATP